MQKLCRESLHILNHYRRYTVISFNPPNVIKAGNDDIWRVERYKEKQVVYLLNSSGHNWDFKVS